MIAHVILKCVIRTFLKDMIDDYSSIATHPISSSSIIELISITQKCYFFPNFFNPVLKSICPNILTLQHIATNFFHVSKRITGSDVSEANALNIADKIDDA